MTSKVKLTYGVGINDADYPTRRYEELPKVDGKRKQKLIWICPFYNTWKSMIRRSYCPLEKLKRPTYKDVFVCDEWLTFSNFKSWMEQQDWEGNQLDKDIIKEGNQEYCPEFCAFVTRKTNMFLVDRGAARGELPLGVSLCRGWYRAECCIVDGTGQRYLGLFKSPEEAHLVYLKEKHSFAMFLAEQQTDVRVSEALKTRFLSAIERQIKVTEEKCHD